MEYAKVAFWEGRPVVDLSKDELIAALNWCANELDRFYSPEHSRAYAAGRAALLVRDNRRAFDN